MAEITLVKGEASALDRTWMSMPDGSGIVRLEWPLPRAALGS